MFTQCPDCSKLYPVTKKQIRAKKSKFYCPTCKKKFNVSDSLITAQTLITVDFNPEIKDIFGRQEIQDSNADLPPDPSGEFQLIDASRFLKHRLSNVEAADSQRNAGDTELLPWETEKKPLIVNWFIGLIIGLVLLAAQVLYFESSAWVQSPVYRPYLEKICQWFGCRLAEYQNLAEISVLQSSLSTKDDKSLMFKAVLINEGAFRQLLPNIKISLLDYNDQVFAQRIFNPDKYLPGSSLVQSSLIAAGETVEISLNLAKTVPKIGGYRFEFVEQ